ncbi:MAG: SDR family oxidoreductase [Cytophagales bacterium]|nr:SDR family oxidoreductase [Cytophagales bacterium]
MKPKSKHILITGTSSGIGYGAAKELIHRGYTVFGSVRKKEDGEKVRTELGERFIPFVFDVTDQPAIDAAVEDVKKHLNGSGLAGLINNSGISVTGPVEHLDIEKVAYNFDVNVLGIFRLTKAFLPLLGTQKDHPTQPGRILNVSSVAGKLCAPFMAPYTGTKHAVEGISHCLRRELLPYGIDVIIIGPGPVQTPIWDKGGLDEFKNTRYIASMVKFFTYFVTSGKNGMPLEECSQRIANILEASKPNVRYALVQGKFKNWTLPLMMPPRAVDKFFQKNFG